MRSVFFLIFLICCVVTGATSAVASLSGFAEWRYAEYQSEEDGKKIADASHFTQHYSLLYEKSASLSGGRAGYYSLALGAEWLSLNTEVNGEDIDLDTAKILYRGEILIAPGGLPFRLHLYSRDIKKSNLQAGGSIPSAVIAPSIINDVSNGTHIVSGATLLLGIRNGSYLGRYRDVMSQLPRILVDFQQEDVRDLKAATRQHYRIRDLAFVSLNKKDNWFHYRHHDYTDFLNPDQDTVEKSYTLGTIDHTLARRWINLTNWIKVSADGTYSVSEELAGDEPVDRRYNINAFATARRTTWNAATLMTFGRFAKGDDLEKNLEVPFFLNGEPDRNTAWRFAFEGYRNQFQDRSKGTQVDEESVFASTRIETFRQRRYLLTSQFEGEVKSGDRGEGYGVRGRLEFSSNSRYRSPYKLFGSYSITRLAGTDSDGGDVAYWENDVTARVNVDLSSRLRTGLEERLLYGTGSLGQNVTRHIGVRGGQGLVTEEGDFNVRKGDTLRSTTTWFVEDRAGRLTQRLNLTYDFLSTDESTTDSLSFSHHLGYSRRYWNFRMSNSIIFSDAIRDDETVDTREFNHNSFLRYSPGRAWDGDLNVDYNYSEDGIDTNSRWNVEQQYRYNFFTVNGIVRKLVEVREEIEYERYQDLVSGTQSATKFTLSSTYFPSAQTLLRAEVAYSTFSPAEYTLFQYGLEAGFNFRKLQVRFNYDYGLRTPDDKISEIKEHRWEVVLRKVF